MRQWVAESFRMVGRWMVGCTAVALTVTVVTPLSEEKALSRSSCAPSCA